MFLRLDWGAKGLDVSRLSLALCLTLLLVLFLVELGHVEGFVNILRGSQIMKVIKTTSAATSVFEMKCQ